MEKQIYQTATPEMRKQLLIRDSQATELINYERKLTKEGLIEKKDRLVWKLMMKPRFEHR